MGHNKRLQMIQPKQLLLVFETSDITAFEIVTLLGKNAKLIFFLIFERRKSFNLFLVHMHPLKSGCFKPVFYHSFSEDKVMTADCLFCVTV